MIGDILLGTIYIPPESSVHANHDIFDQISIAVVELLNYWKISKVCLLGGPKQNNANNYHFTWFSMCFGALYLTEMLQIIIINCYQWLSAVFINSYI